MSDFYTENPEELKGKPKDTLAEYIQQNRILTPRRFATLEDALSSGVPIIARSEHPQDYDGASGILSSPVILPGQSTTEAKLMEQILNEKDKYSNFRIFCSLMKINEAKFASQVSFSFWEKIPGINSTLVADSTIRGRYHIFVKGMSPCYIEADNGNLRVFANGTTRYLDFAVQKLIDFYEKIRRQTNFDPNHSYIVEAQISKDQVYFLQIHRGRDFNRSKFDLERAPEQGEYETTLVRGSTIPEGKTFKTIICYAHEELKDVEGSIGTLTSLTFQELMYRRTGLQITQLVPGGSLSHTLRSHGDISKFLKPEVSVVLDSAKFAQLLPRLEYKELVEKKTRTGEDQHIQLHVVSDGRRAYISRTD